MFVVNWETSHTHTGNALSSQEQMPAVTERETEKETDRETETNGETEAELFLIKCCFASNSLKNKRDVSSPDQLLSFRSASESS